MTDVRDEGYDDFLDALAAGEVVTHTTITVATPSFGEDTTYVTAVTDFGPVQLTGQVRGVEPDAVETGMVVGADVEEAETTGEPLVVFRPR